MTAIPTLLYGSEIWSPTRDEISRLESWQNRCMKYMLGIFYRKHGNVSGAKLRQKCRLHKIEKLLRVRRLIWFGHVARMEEGRLPRKMLTAYVGTKRPRGRPRKSWRKTITEDLDTLGADYTKKYPNAVKDRNAWRKLIISPYRRKPTRSMTVLRRSTRLAKRR